MNLNDDQLKKLVTLGCLGYSVDQCVNVVDPDDEAAFRHAFQSEGSAVWKAYRKGIDIAAFAIDSKLFDMAKGGDTKALAKLEERQRLRQLK